jgi:hypothetical protein
MANTIRIKRRIGGSTGAPATLGAAELAFNENSGGRILYYGLGDDSTGVATSVIAIGGPDFAVTATTNANLTGPITSVGNATSIASQTGTGSKFVVDTSPTLVTPVLGVSTATSVNKITLTAPATGSTLTIQDGFTLTANGNATVSGTNTGDNATNTNYSGLVTNATHTGDATGATALTVVAINGTLMSGLATGILKNTTTTGVPSIAVAADFPTLNQDTTGKSATVTTNANLTGPITSSGNATSIASQTGTGTKFVVDTSPTLVTPDIGVATGTSLVLSGDLTVNGTTTTISSTTLAVGDKNIILASAATTDAGADGGGLTLKGATDHTWNWVNATDAWTSSDHVDIASGKSYYINGTVVLSATALGSGIIIDGGTF